MVLSPADTISISDFNVQGQSKLGAGQWVTLRGNRTEAEAHAADAEASSLVDHDDADDWEII